MPSYPETRRDESVVENQHGTDVADPYRWLEDTWSDETLAWVKQQNELTESVLAAIPQREEIRARLTEIWDYPRVGVPFPRGGRWFQLRNTGLQPQGVLWVMDNPDAEGQVLLDPNILSDDGSVSLSGYTVSPDGRLLAYATSDSGSDWTSWRVRDIDSGTDFDDKLVWSRYGEGAFDPAGEHLFYTAFDQPEAGRELLAEARIGRIMRHRIGTQQSDDEVIFVAPDEPEWLPFAEVTNDGRYLVVVVNRGTFQENALHVLDMQRPDDVLEPVANDFTAKVWVIGSVDRTLYVMTDDSAERLRICSVDLDNDDPTDRSNWREIVAESDDTITEAHVYADLLFVHYLHDAHSQIHVFDLDGNALRRVELPGIVSVVEMSGDDHTPLVHLAVSSFTEPTSIWQHNRETAQTTLLAAAQCRLASNDLVTEQVFVTSYDGTRLPVFLVHRRDVVPSGDVPVFLYGYGGFNIAMTPSFMPARALWAERGGLYAVAVLRGGGEYGKAWHDAGRLANKQNVFEDFCAVAQWLGGESGWSRPSRVAIHGGSNGGLLVGACLTQRPELFGAATPAVGVLDMLRFHKFTIGWAWASDYGSPDDAEDFAQLLSYSPLHNIKPGATYPPTLVITGDHDDRVAPGHSFKFAAALQAAQAGDAPVLIRVETSVGHGAGKPTQKAIDEATDLLAFLEHNLLS